MTAVDDGAANRRDSEIGEKPSADVPAGDRRRVRLAGRAAAVIGSLSLAGCSLLGSEGANGQSGDPTARSGENDGQDEQETDNGGRSGWTTGPGEEGTQRPIDVSSMSPSECEQRLAEIETEIATIREETATFDKRYPIVERERREVRKQYERWEPIPDDVVTTAESVGTDARDAVVYLQLGQGGMATGWYVDDHHVLTNAHNVFNDGKRVDAITAWTLDGDDRPAEVLGFVDSFVPDVALLRTAAVAPATLPIGSATLEPDQYLVQVGHPGGIGNWLLSLGTFERETQSPGVSGERVRDLVTTVPGRSGVSGSPLLDLDGNIVAMTHGGGDISTRRIGAAPSVAADVVYDRPIAPRQESLHVPIDLVVETYEQWL